MKYYIYSIKLEEESLSLEEFVHKIDLKVKIEKLVSQDSWTEFFSCFCFCKYMCTEFTTLLLIFKVLYLMIILRLMCKYSHLVI